MPHRSRLCYITIDVNDFDTAIAFWTKALGATLDLAINKNSESIYQRLTLPDSNIHILLQLVPEKKASKSRVHIDIETNDVESEVSRLELLGAKRQRLVEERGFRFWNMIDPFDNEFCVIQTEYPELLVKGQKW